MNRNFDTRQWSGAVERGLRLPVLGSACPPHNALWLYSLRLIRLTASVAGEFVPVAEFPAVCLCEAQSSQRRESAGIVPPPRRRLRTPTSLAALPASSAASSRTLSLRRRWGVFLLPAPSEGALQCRGCLRGPQEVHVDDGGRGIDENGEHWLQPWGLPSIVLVYCSLMLVSCHVSHYLCVVIERMVLGYLVHILINAIPVTDRGGP
jgi:hypothetical protein